MAVGVSVGAGVTVAVGVTVGVSVAISVTVAMAVGVTVGVLAEVAVAVAVGVGVLASVTDWRHYYRRDSPREKAPTTCDRRPLCAHQDCWRLRLTSVENYSRVVDFKRIAGNGWRSRRASSERRAEPAQHTRPQA
jgi:hypothetical protein